MSKEARLMTTETETTAREQIGALLIDRAAAITARDARRAVAHYAPEFVSFMLAPPLRYAGDVVGARAGMEDWFLATRRRSEMALRCQNHRSGTLIRKRSGVSALTEVQRRERPTC
jgi:ketosteroid isomerase-like protein